MKIKEKDGEIILRDIPFAAWIFGLILSIFFLFGFYGLMSSAIKFPSYQFGLQERWYWIAANVVWFIFVTALCLAAAGYYFSQILTPMITTRVKSDLQTIDIIYRRLFFFKTTQRFYFSQVQHFARAERREDNKPSHFFVLKLVNDDEIDLEASGSATDINFHIIVKLNDILKGLHSKNDGKTRRFRQRKAKRGMKGMEK